jgi:uncharacterized protein (DUF924 family)
MTDINSADDVLAFWIKAGPEKWYKKDDAFDAAIRDNFLATYEAAAAGRLSAWEGSAESALALIILLDQFPRNMFRGSPRAWATDRLARDVADSAISQGFDQSIDKAMRAFFYLPFMHSEDLEDQLSCVELCGKLGNESNLKYAEIHAEVIRRFGRFPHRNPVLGRETSAEEQAFLESGGFSG